MRRTTHTILYNKAGTLPGRLVLLLAVILPLLAACITDDESYCGDCNQSTVTLNLPGVLTRATGDTDNSGDSYIPVENGTQEGGINPDKGLWFFAFAEGKYGKTVIKNVFNEMENATGNTHHKQFSVKLEHGKYRFYLAGNIEGASKARSANELEGLVLQYTQENIAELKPGNLPMYREGVTVEVNDTDDPQIIDMHLTFLCSKVELKMKKADIEPANDIKLTRLQVGHVAASSMTDQALCRARQDLNYLGETDKIDIPFEGEKNLTTEAQTMATFYLPEYYNEGFDGRTPTQLFFTLGGKDYTLPLGGKAYNSATATDAFKGGDLNRGVCYELTTTPGRDIALKVEEWDTHTLDLNFLSWLDVSCTGEDKSTDNNYDHALKTQSQILVTSQYADSISYSSSAETIMLECLDKLEDKPLVIANAMPENGRIRFTVNPDIAISEYGEGKTTGTVKIAIKADNLVKYIDVQYNVTPFLKVTPWEVEIITHSNEAQPIYTVSYETNLDGITIDREKLTNADGTDGVTIRYDQNLPKGTIRLQADGKAKNTWSATFKVSPAATGYDSYAQEVTVTVLPILGNYKIHFIAINDDRYSDSNGNHGTQARIHNTLTTDGNPTDGWKNHNIYIYTQYGMSSGNEIPQSVWYFFDTDGLGGKPYWPGVSMRPDPENPGWMLYELGFTFQGVSDLTTSQTKYPIPGETLIMFNAGGSEYVHRYPYDMEPGVPLFDFNNREGWFVYDCTTSNYEFYNSKPDIYLATYKMYHLDDSPAIDNWFRKYGRTPVGADITVWDKVGSDDYRHIKVIDDCGVVGWKCSELPLWTVRGRENKSVIVKNQFKDDNTMYGILFGGKRFENNTGYHDYKEGKAGEWHEGVPEPITTVTP